MHSWAVKHAPKKFVDLKFSNEKHYQVLSWFKNKSQFKKCVIFGPMGCGKYSLVLTCAKLFKYNAIILDEDEALEKVANASTTLDGKRNLIVADEQFIKNKYVFNKLKYAKIPVVFISTETYLNDNAIQMFKIFKPTMQVCLDIAENVLKKEKMQLSTTLIMKVIDECDYDLRNILNTLQIVCYTQNETFSGQNFQKISTLNKFHFINRLVKNKLSNNEIIENYSPFAIDTLRTGVKDLFFQLNHICDLYEASSMCDIYNHEYKWLHAKQYNIICNYYKNQPLFEYMKNETVAEEYDYERSWYSNLFESSHAVEHLQTILRSKEEKSLTEPEKKIMKIKVIKEELKTEKVLRYKSKKLSSNSIKRDLKTSDFMKW